MHRLILFLVLVLPGIVWAEGSFDITDPDQVAALSELQEKLDAISALVTPCVASGKDHRACMCESESLIIDFNEAVNTLFETYPALRTLDLVSFRRGDGMTASQSLSGIRNQAAMDLACP